MKIKVFMLLLLGMVLAVRLLAPTATNACADRDRALRASDARGQSMQMAAHARHVAPIFHAEKPGFYIAKFGGEKASGDCCHRGHPGSCPVADCLAAVLSRLIVVDTPQSRPVSAAQYSFERYDQPISTHYRPPIFA